MLEVKTVPPEERTVRWGAALSQESEAEPRLETLQGRRAAPPSWPVMLYSPGPASTGEVVGSRGSR